jgi:hypothetical protein
MTLKTGIIIEDVDDWGTEELDDDGNTVSEENFRAARVLLPNGHETTAFIHNEPGEYSRYKRGDRVRLSWHDQEGDAAGCSIEGKFGDDFIPADPKNKESHGPTDGDYRIISRQTLFLLATGGNVLIDGELVRLGSGSAGNQVPIALNQEVLADTLALHNLLDPNPPSPFGLILEAIAAGVPAVAPLIEGFTEAWRLAEPSSNGADNVVARPGDDE